MYYYTLPICKYVWYDYGLNLLETVETVQKYGAPESK